MSSSLNYYNNVDLRGKRISCQQYLGFFHTNNSPRHSRNYHNKIHILEGICQYMLHYQEMKMAHQILPNDQMLAHQLFLPLPGEKHDNQYYKYCNMKHHSLIMS